jgi:hypothetical protein
MISPVRKKLVYMLQKTFASPAVPGALETYISIYNDKSSHFVINSMVAS